jgi:predicted dithiol-disulfide oxidoreductase (DUF899 family)
VRSRNSSPPDRQACAGSCAARPLTDYFGDVVTADIEDDEAEDVPGLSCFVRDGDEIFHTYSTYARGSEQTISAYALLDMTAFGRSEDWEEPKGRARALHGADPTFTD